MADETGAPEAPQIYLITPPTLELSSFPKRLSEVMEAVDVACIRLALASSDEQEIARAADALREVAHAHDVALVIEAHLNMVERLGLDGVHLTDGARSVRNARKALGASGARASRRSSSTRRGRTRSSSTPPRPTRCCTSSSSTGTGSSSTGRRSRAGRRRSGRSATPSESTCGGR